MRRTFSPGIRYGPGSSCTLQSGQRMSITIRDRKVERLARLLSIRTRESQQRAIKKALEERLERLQALERLKTGDAARKDQSPTAASSSVTASLSGDDTAAASPQDAQHSADRP